MSGPGRVAAVAFLSAVAGGGVVYTALPKAPPPRDIQTVATTEQVTPVSSATPAAAVPEIVPGIILPGLAHSGLIPPLGESLSWQVIEAPGVLRGVSKTAEPQVQAAATPTPRTRPDAGREPARAMPPVRIGPSRPTQGSPPAPSGTAPSSAGRGLVNINTASIAELELLPGIGPAIAARIIDHRQKHGPFTSVEGLDDVVGIGPRMLERLRPLVTVGPER